MPKTATITIQLVPQAAKTPNNKIKKEIQKDANIPCGAKIQKIEITNDTDLAFEELSNME